MKIVLIITYEMRIGQSLTSTAIIDEVAREQATIQYEAFDQEDHKVPPTQYGLSAYVYTRSDLRVFVWTVFEEITAGTPVETLMAPQVEEGRSHQQVDGK
jgi:hypothetical protein